MVKAKSRPQTAKKLAVKTVDGKKIPCPYGRVGSIPTPATKEIVIGFFHHLLNREKDSLEGT